MLLVISSSDPGPPPKKKSKDSKQSSAEAVQSILADIIQHNSTSASDKDPQDEAESEIVHFSEFSHKER